LEYMKHGCTAPLILLLSGDLEYAIKALASV
jgi:hypothetical protein